jgi:hypothetical protein
MSKQTNKKQIEHTIIHPAAERAGAIALTALSLLVSFEGVLEHSLHGDHDQGQPAISEVIARGETKGETARLPEEFDIGLQTPHITGI